MDKYIITSLICLLTVSLSVAQDIKADLEKMNNFYKDADKLSMEASVYKFADVNDKEGKLMSHAKMKRSGNNYYSKFLDIEVVNADKCVLVIKHDEKRIVLAETYQYEEALERFDASKSARFLRYADSVTFEGNENGVIRYQCYFSKGEFTQVNLSMDSQDFYLKQLDYFYRAIPGESDDFPTKISAVYTKVEHGINLGTKWFSTDHYVSFNAKDEPVLTQAYKNYNLIINEPNSYEQP